MSDKISRRDFIVRSAAGAVIGGVALSMPNLGMLFANSVKGKFSRSGNDIIIKLSDPKNADLANVNGSILLDDDNILVRISQTQFLAVNLICRHKGCTVDLTGDKFVCPCHGSEYDINGKVTHGPAKANLRTWPTNYDIDKGIVTVTMSEKIEKDDSKSSTNPDTNSGTSPNNNVGNPTTNPPSSDQNNNQDQNKKDTSNQNQNQDTTPKTKDK